MDEDRESEEEERASAAGPSDASSTDQAKKIHQQYGEIDVRNDSTEDDDGDDDDDDDDEGFEAFAERNRNLLESGCGKQTGGERKRVVRAFWTAMWPILEDLGWSKDEGRGKEEGLVFFKTPDQVEEYDRIKDVIDRILVRKDPAEALAADAYEANLAKSSGGVGPFGGGGAATTASTALSGSALSSAARRAAVLPISRNRKKKEETTSGGATGGGGEGKSTSSSSSTAGAAAHRGHKGGSKDSAAAKSAGLHDVSWKDGGKSFPKRTSRVGNRYQVSRIPEAGMYDPTQPPESDKLCTLIWDPAQAEEKGVNDATIADLPHGIKVAALFRLAELGYDETALLEGLKSIKPTDGSTWGQERRDRFRDELFKPRGEMKLRKDLKAVCKSMRISMKTCLAYYYGTFKFSDDYRLLKTVCLDEETARTEDKEHEVDACAVCGDGGNLLICDGCDGEYHMECCRPALRTVPEGSWLCDECVDRKFLAARQYVIKSSKLFERHHCQPDDDDNNAATAAGGPNGKKRTHEATRNDDELPEGLEKVMFKPTDDVLVAVRKFAKGLNQLFATGKVTLDGTMEVRESVSKDEDASMKGDEDEALGKDEAMEDANPIDAPGVVAEAPAPSVPAVEGAAT